MPTWDSLWTNVNLATMAAGDVPYGAIEKRCARGQGRADRLGRRGIGSAAPRCRRGGGRRGGWLTPGLIDCHTHLVFAGDRSGEFEQRLKGVSYEEIARAGGGIARTVAATRQAAHSELEDTAARRLACLLAEGVTTVEIKSGYGLDRITEIKMLEVARGSVKATLWTSAPPSLAPTPCRESSRTIAPATSTWCARRCCRRWPNAGSPMRSMRSARASRSPRTRWLACSKPPGRSACRSSCTPINSRISAALRSRRASARSQPIISSTPASRASRPWQRRARWRFCCLERSILCASASSPRRAVAPAWRAHRAGHRLQSRLLAHPVDPGHLNMACTLFGLTPEEALAGVTRHAARALGLDDRGTLAVGKRADLALWRIHRPAELSYWLGWAPLDLVLRGGRRRYPRATR